MKFEKEAKKGSGVYGNYHKSKPYASFEKRLKEETHMMATGDYGSLNKKSENIKKALDKHKK